MATQRRPSFRAVIVGGGPSGLALAHCLHAANINYVVLERRQSIVEFSGAGLGCWPQSTRILSQLGLLDAAIKIASRLKMSYQLHPDGSEISHEPVHPMIEDKHGLPWLLFERARFIEMLYNTQPDLSLIKAGKEAVAIEQDDYGVTVRLADGTQERGDIVIGADGVHSKVRDLMWAHIESLPPNEGKPKEKIEPKARYQCMYGVSPMPAAETAGDMIETHDRKWSFQTLNQEEDMFWFMYNKLPVATCEKTKYTPADAEALAAKHMKAAISKHTRFEELWNTKKRVVLANLEEGMQQLWHSGRIVIVGDAAHKMTPNIGFGFNNAFESCASLTNQLHKLLNSDGAELSSPNTADLEKAFEAYQSQRYSRAKICHDVSGLYTGMAAWDHIWYKWLAYLSPMLQPATVFVNRIAHVVKGAVKLDFLDVPDYKRGSVIFDDEVEGGVKDIGRAQGNATYIVLSVAAVGTFAWALSRYVET